MGVLERTEPWPLFGKCGKDKLLSYVYFEISSLKLTHLCKKMICCIDILILMKKGIRLSGVLWPEDKRKLE